MRVRHRARPAGAWLVAEPFQPGFQEPRPPLACRRPRYPQVGRHPADRAAIRAGQHDPRAQRQRLSGLPAPRPPLQDLPLVIGQHDRLKLRARHEPSLLANQELLTQDTSVIRLKFRLLICTLLSCRLLLRRWRYLMRTAPSSAGWSAPGGLAWLSVRGSSWRARIRLTGIPGWRLSWGFPLRRCASGAGGSPGTARADWLTARARAGARPSWS